MQLFDSLAQMLRHVESPRMSKPGTLLFRFKARGSPMHLHRLRAPRTRERVNASDVPRPVSPSSGPV